MEGYFAEVRLFAGNFAPMYWAFCQGQTMSINENTALYSLLGTQYGGDGQQTFSLPDLRGRVPVGIGTGTGLPFVFQGEQSGNEYCIMQYSQMPAHTHPVTSGTTGLIPVDGDVQITMNVNNNPGTNPSPENNFIAGYSGLFTNASSNNDSLASHALNVNTNNLSVNLGAVQASLTGAGQPISTMMPFLVLNYIICVEGIYPSRN